MPVKPSWKTPSWNALTSALETAASVMSRSMEYAKAHIRHNMSPNAILKRPSSVISAIPIMHSTITTISFLPGFCFFTKKASTGVNTTARAHIPQLYAPIFSTHLKTFLFQHAFLQTDYNNEYIFDCMHM